jgi:hypothetical protein
MKVRCYSAKSVHLNVSSLFQEINFMFAKMSLCFLVRFLYWLTREEWRNFSEGGSCLRVTVAAQRFDCETACGDVSRGG